MGSPSDRGAVIAPSSRVGEGRESAVGCLLGWPLWSSGAKCTAVYMMNMSVHDAGSRMNESEDSRFAVIWRRSRSLDGRNPPERAQDTPFDGHVKAERPGDAVAKQTQRTVSSRAQTLCSSFGNVQGQCLPLLGAVRFRRINAMPRERLLSSRTSTLFEFVRLFTVSSCSEGA